MAKAFVCIVEDDDIMLDTLMWLLWDRFPHLDVKSHSSESAAGAAIENGDFDGAVAAIVDLRLRWGHGEPHEIARSEGPPRAGLRLVRLLQQRHKPPPICLRTLADPWDVEREMLSLPDKIKFVGKTEPEQRKLVEWLRTLL